MDRKQLTITKNKLIKEQLFRVSCRVKSEVTPESTVAECEKRWNSIFEDRMQSQYARFVNLHDFMPESVFISRFYPLIAHLSEWKCNKTRAIAKAKNQPFQVTTKFTIHNGACKCSFPEFMSDAITLFSERCSVILFLRRH